MSSFGGRAQFERLGPLIVTVAAVSILFVAATLLLVDARMENTGDLYRDTYELTGSRLTGLISFVGVVLLTATASICLFASRIIRSLPGSDRWSRFLLGVSLLTAVLATDDYLAIHELPGEMLEAGRVVQNALELAVLGIWGLLFAVLFWRHRSTIALTEWILLAIAAVLLATSLALDLAPHSWMAATFGFALDAQDLVEDTLKLVGIAFCATYFVRASALAVRTMAD